jgi:beta-glucosidase
VIAAWFPGVQSGPALVRTLFGESVPSGKLVVSWPHSIGQIPDYYNALNTGRPAGNTDLTRPPKEGTEKYVSRYVDEPNVPRFPFGYGLSYTEFRYSAPELEATTLSAKELTGDLHNRSTDSKTVLTARAYVTNSGKVAAEEVVQLYVGLRGTSVAEPVRALKAFQRIALAPGETRMVTFALTPEAFALWDIHNDRSVEPSHVRLWISPDSQHGQPVEFDIAE